jgi:hypothetical protein
MWWGVWDGVLSPRPGLVIHGGRNPALTRWAIICRPSGPGAADWGQGLGTVLVSFAKVARRIQLLCGPPLHRHPE